MLLPNFILESTPHILTLALELMEGASDPTQTKNADQKSLQHLPPLLKQVIALGDHYMWLSYNYIKVPLMFGEEIMK